MPIITRVEVIDNTGRAYVNSSPNNDIQLSFQDDGRTLKIFVLNCEKDVNITTIPITMEQGRLDIPLPRKKITEQKRVSVIKLRGNGYSVREIMQIVGYKSPRSVHQILNEANLK